MIERRALPRTRLDVPGRICLDEHRSVSCLVYDRSERGVRVTLPEADLIPDTFLLEIEQAPTFFVCRLVWRKGEEIGAQLEAA
ncbi:PilZ domain-containing protein [Methylobacterium sp. J-067]|uniref:PilZ domain-containing protein n=1 Tax=Methylobacterium sp. J-067 TaxID=2836648 RepID=UPI001FBABA97|nr:PilZ domain-containing protein [Methylobacterium sp. J-067]MCJ2023520.1 PilZ domain-containing protein [Methylobacterium sp. J-067]